MRVQLNDIVPLIRKHFDFLETEFGFSRQRTWKEEMTRCQGAEYQRAHLLITVEQSAAPRLEVQLSVREGVGTASRIVGRIAAPELWAQKPGAYAWPRPIEQDEEQLRFLAASVRQALPGFLREGPSD